MIKLSVNWCHIDPKLIPQSVQTLTTTIEKSVDAWSYCLERMLGGGVPHRYPPRWIPLAALVQKSRGAAAKPRSRTTFLARACKNLVHQARFPQRVNQGSFGIS